ncbi:MAG: glycosyltransferase [bacterium]|nr:glycosyltransferase [bacterium]
MKNVKAALLVMLFMLAGLANRLPVLALQGEADGLGQAEGIVHTIQPEDTLWDLSILYGLTVEQILAANPDLNPYQIPVGTRIVIPVHLSSRVAQPSATWSAANNVLNAQTDATAIPSDDSTAIPSTYALQPGDTLYALAYRFNVDYEALLAANPGLNWRTLSIGQVINIPGGTPVTDAAEPAAPTASAATPALPALAEMADLSAALLEDAPLLESETAPASSFIPPVVDEFSLIQREVPEQAAPVIPALAEAEAAEAAADIVPTDTPPDPALLTSNLYPVTIALEEGTVINAAALSVNGVTLAIFDEPPYTYDLDINTLAEGRYTLTFTTQNLNGVSSAADYAFEIAPLVSDEDASAVDVPLGVFVNGAPAEFKLTFSAQNGLRPVQPEAQTLAAPQGESLIDILMRPANLIPSDVRAAVTQQRPELFSIVIIIMTLTLIPQGVFTLIYMLYTWNNPEIAEQYRSPKQFIAPKFSFTAILPARREENVIYDTIRAIDAIEYPDELKEILVMIRDDDDDATIAEAHRAIRESGKDNIRVITFTDGPKNKPNGLNRGLRAATKDVVCIFDAEDQPHREIYNVINTVMDRDNADVVQSGVQLMNFKSTWFSALNCLEYYFWFKSGLHAFTRMFHVTPLGGNTVFFKRHWVEKVGGWDEQGLTEDADIGLRLTQAGAKIQIVYDEKHATQEETPDSVEQFVKQRTRWNQGFYQIFLKGDWIKMPTMRQRVTALYILLNSLFQALIVLYLPLGVFIALTQRLPVPVALISYIPIFMLLTQLVVNLIGLREFTAAYGERLPFLFRLKTALVYYPFQLMLSFSAARAIWRLLTNRSSWEKTAHSNLHRQAAQGSA